MNKVGGKVALYEITRSRPCIKNRVPANVEDAVVKMAVEFLTSGQERVSNELRKIFLEMVLDLYGYAIILRILRST